MTGVTETGAGGPAVTAWGWRAYAVAAAVIVLDQLSKLWIVANMAVGQTIEVLWPLQFTRIWNEGVSFGLFQAENDLVRWGMVGFNLLVAGLLIYWTRIADRLLAALGFALIIAGAMGNAIDRARFGAVVDFVDVSRIGFFPWIFNIADSGITVGVVLILLDSLRRERPS